MSRWSALEEDKKKKNVAIEAFYNIDAYLCSFWIFVQQLLVAASTVFIIKLISELSDNNKISIVYLLLFVASLIVVYIPTAVSHMYLKKFKYTSYFKYINNFIDRNKGKATLSHDTVKSKHESWITNESYIIYDESTLLLYDVFSSFLNAVVSILAIAYMLDMYLIFGYMVAFIILYASSKYFKPTINTSSHNVQSNRKSMSGILLSAWDNIFIGNTNNLDNWRRVFKENLMKLKISEVRYTVVRAWISSLTVILALFSIAITTTFYIYQNMSDQAALAGLIVTLPRQIQIIQRIFAFFGLALEWQGMLIRLKKLQEPFYLKNNLEQYIDWEKIKLTINDKSYSYTSVQDIIDLIDAYKHGRICIQGENGAGKSCILLNIAEHFGEKAYFIPTNSDLQFKDENFNAFSKGQKIVSILNEIKESDIKKVIILDEWDANLDDKNVYRLNQCIDKFSQNTVVIEVRHLKNRNNRPIL